MSVIMLMSSTGDFKESFALKCLEARRDTRM